MRRLTTLVLLGLALAVSACGEQTAPFAADGALALQGILRDRQTTSTRKTARVRPARTVQIAKYAPPLKSLTATVRAVQGTPQRVEISFENPNGRDERYLRLDIPADARLVDEAGRLLRQGESTDLTVEVDPDAFVFHFGPHGSTFPGQPAVLTVSLKYADWKGRSILDASQLELWYQSSELEDWQRLTNVIAYDPLSMDATVPLLHFSNYAIAW